MEQNNKKISVGVVLAIIFAALIGLAMIGGIIYILMPSAGSGSNGSGNIFSYSNNNDFDHMRDGDGYDASRPVSKQMPLDQFMELDVNVDSMTVIIKPGDKYEVDYETVEGLEPSITQNGKTLNITQQGSITNPMQDYMSELYIMVPQNAQLATAKITCGGTHIHIRDVTIYVTNLITSAGDIVVANVNSQATAAKSAAGSITMESVDMGQSELSTDSGDITVRASRYGDINAGANAGNIHIEGSVEDISNYNMNLVTNIGKITVQSQEQGSNYTTSGGSFAMNITTNAGDISIQ